MRLGGNGRDHIILARLNHEFLIELHWDNKMHFLCFDVDYRKRPSLVFQQELEAKLTEVSSSHFISGGYTWFTRKNMSVFGGLRIYSPSNARVMPSIYKILLPFFIILAPIFLVGAKTRSFLEQQKKS